MNEQEFAELVYMDTAIFYWRKKMEQIGKKYFYETRAGTIKHAMLVRA